MKIKKVLPLVALVVVGLFLVSLWIGWEWYVTNKYPATGKISEETLQVSSLRGQYGDMFGGINALFTALLLAGAIYTIWIQQKQIESLKEQQIAYERESNRSATLMATTALVNAKSTLISTRYKMNQDFITMLKSENISQDWRPYLEVMAFGNAEIAGNDFKDLDQLAKELAELIDSTREVRQDPAA